ncbi:mechanosensitive ion channel family protein [Geomicrobium sp. JSM 1781026]|uniref:mechanosensitive ion channel family protein n=1 Tax=unclassified Geomicrobium TaxID=2628951 RepID=UPI0005A73ADC|nr:mechanosensitive ion channel family protein [Geomicrobium sp. JCM 19037]
MYHDWIAMYPWLQYVVAFIIIMFFLFLRKVFTRYVFAFILRLSRKSKSELLPNILLSFQRPVRFFFVILGLYLAIQYLVPDDPTAAVERRMEVVNTFFRSSVILMFGWGFFNVSGTSSNLFKKLSMRLDSGEDSMLVPFLSKLLRVLIVALTVVVILDTFGFDINGFVAGLGLGGLAFALAAQDTIGNLFGGIIIVTEKPFKKDDWIETPTVEGIVEDISFRSTKVRTFSEGLVTVPNSTLAHEPITNWSEMTKRQIAFEIQFRYDTPMESLKVARERIESELKGNEAINQETIFVRLHELQESGIELMFYLFTNTTNWEEWLKVKEQLNLRILEILREENVDFAMPSQDLYINDELHLLTEGPDDKLEDKQS